MAKMVSKSSAEVTKVFQQGRLEVEVEEIEVGHDAKPPVPVLIVAPKEAGTYPVALFLHGFFLENHHYKHLLRHIASHGFIMVAPNIQQTIMHTGQDDIDQVAKVADWLPDGLPFMFRSKDVTPELTKLAVAGHSRGGHTAFSMALGLATTEPRLPFSAFIGLDPVAGKGEDDHLEPKILDNNLPPFELAAWPVLVIGTGLGEEGKPLQFSNFFSLLSGVFKGLQFPKIFSLPGGVLKGLQFPNIPLFPGFHFPPGAPKGVNHVQFYRKCRRQARQWYYFVTKDYGHVDMLDDDASWIANFICKSGDGDKHEMRRCVAGIMVAFLNTALGQKDDGDLEEILENPAVAPVTLDPVDQHHVRMISKM